MKKGLKILIWILAGTFVVFIIGFVIFKQGESRCTKITVHISDSTGLKLFDEKEIIGIIDPNGNKIINRPVKEINIAQIEHKLRTKHSIKRAEVYMQINGELIVKTEPRIPLVRICNRQNQHFQIDKEGYLMPVSAKNINRILVANGNISHRPNFDTIINIYSRSFEKRVDIKTLRDIHILASFINSNEFWNAQIQQIYINDADEIEISTLVGKHLVVFGNIDNLEEKFRKLEAFYKKGLPIKGWDNYTEINLKFKNQVVCTKTN